MRRKLKYIKWVEELFNIELKLWQKCWLLLTPNKRELNRWKTIMKGKVIDMISPYDMTPSYIMRQMQEEIDELTLERDEVIEAISNLLNKIKTRSIKDLNEGE